MEYELGTEESVSTAVVRAVSAVQGCHQRAERPRVDVCNPNALDALFEPKEDGTPRTGGHLAFVFGGCRVTLDNGEYLTISPLEKRLLGEPASECTDGRVR